MEMHNLEVRTRTLAYYISLYYVFKIVVVKILTTTSYEITASQQKIQSNKLIGGPQIQIELVDQFAFTYMVQISIFGHGHIAYGALQTWKLLKLFHDGVFHCLASPCETYITQNARVNLYVESVMQFPRQIESKLLLGVRVI